MSDLHADALRVLRIWAPLDDDQVRLRGEYLEFLTQHHDGVFRTCTPGHITASALVMNDSRTQVLLTLHPKVGRWLQLGGHMESEDSSVQRAAWREAWEESGIPGVRMSTEPVRLDRHPVPCGPQGRSEHLDMQYAICVPDGSTAIMTDESLDLRWFPIDALPEGTDSSVRALVAGAVASELVDLT